MSHYEDPFELIGWQGHEFDDVSLIDSIEAGGTPGGSTENIPAVAPEPSGLLRRAAFYAGQAGAGLLLAPVLPFAVPIALGVGLISEQDFGGENIQKVADLAAMPGEFAAGLVDRFTG